MTSEKLGALLHSYADFYWSVPLDFVVERIMKWHPEVTDSQLKRVLKQCNEDLFQYHCRVETEGLDAPELVVEHLLAIDEKDFTHFLEVRFDLPCREYDERTILTKNTYDLDLPEVRDLMAFGRTEMRLDDEWAREFVNTCFFSQLNSLCDGTSWVMDFLKTDQYGPIRFHTIDQIMRFRDLGNRLYQAMPNPVYRGWKPTEIKNPRPLPDDAPKTIEEIPKGFPDWTHFVPDEGAGQSLPPRPSYAAPAVKVGRNDPCPCGSGKKYKQCCGK